MISVVLFDLDDTLFAHRDPAELTDATAAGVPVIHSLAALPALIADR